MIHIHHPSGRKEHAKLVHYIDAFAGKVRKSWWQNFATEVRKSSKSFAKLFCCCWEYTIWKKFSMNLTWWIVCVKPNLTYISTSYVCIHQSVTFVWILTRMNIRIYSVKKMTRTNIRIYSYQNFDTNEYPNKYSDQKYSYIRIYSSHSGLDCHQFCAFTI